MGGSGYVEENENGQVVEEITDQSSPKVISNKEFNLTAFEGTDAVSHPAFPTFSNEIADKVYSKQETLDAWLWFKKGYEATNS